MALRCVVPVALAFTTPLLGQQTSVKTLPPPPPPVGTLSGHVVASDTQRPARFATVSLLAMEQPDHNALYADSFYKGPKTPTTAMVQGHTGVDGSYTIAAVPVGDYYVVGTLPGYVLPLASVPEDEPLSVDKLLANLPVVHIAADRTATQDLTLRHGATLTGHIRYEDGSAASGFTLRLEPVGRPDPLQYGRFPLLGMLRNEQGFVRSNDAGGYRISGLEPGKYRVRTEFLVEGGGRYTDSAHGVGTTYREQQYLEIWQPGVFTAKDAKVIEVKTDETVSDLDITVALSNTHRVSGHVAVKEDRHVPDHVYVSLASPTDETYRRYVSADASGAFHIDYVPPGTYTLQMNNADDADPPADPAKPYDYKITRRYARAEESVIVGEHDVVADELLLSPIKDGQK